MSANSNTPSITIDSIKFNNGNSEIKFNDDDIVLLVGANNAGKSRTLKDLREDLMDEGGSKVLIDSIKYKSIGFTTEGLLDYFERNVGKEDRGGFTASVGVDTSYCYSEFDFKNISDENKKRFYKVLFSFLSTENRLSITRPIRFCTQVDKIALNMRKKIEERPEAISALNKALETGFQKSIEVYDHYENGETPVKEYKFGNSDEINIAIKSNSRDSRSMLKDQESLQNQGDGVRSAVAILASLIVNEHSLFLIDEPETFLHPPQAKFIGRCIVDMSKNKQCFIATHNIDFIKGVVEADSSRVKIIKINRTGDTNTFTLVDNRSITEIATDRNLKYTSILDGLFYGNLALCENETDCKFYASLLESLNLPKYQDTLFCAVGGKDQYKKVIPLLKKLGIQYLAIADIDLINSQDCLRQLLDAIEPSDYKGIKTIHSAFLDEFQSGTNAQVKTQKMVRDEINGIFNDDTYLSRESIRKIKDLIKEVSRFDLLKKAGRGGLPQGVCVALFDQINRYLRDRNIFIVEPGEIERFVPDVSGHGGAWLEKVFTAHPCMDDEVYDQAKKFIRTVFGID